MAASILEGFLSLLKPLGDIAASAIKAWGDHQSRQATVQEAELKVKVADLEAKAQLAAYRAASEVEWDLAWAGQAQTSWKDEYILILWSAPAIVMFPAMFIPGLRDYAVETLTFLQTLNPDIMTFYMSGWGIIFAATFGIKTAMQAMVGDKVSKVAEAFKLLPDDIPKDAVEAAQKAIQKKVK